MKKFTILLTIVILVVATVLSGCGNSAQKYFKYDMEKYITISDFKTEIDSSSSTFKQYYNEFLEKNLSYKVEDGEIKDGDTANIDYVGYLNGKAFDGGTAQGYDLKIGSKTFIDGFESSLIGAKVGKETEINVTFPKDYQESSLRGQAVIFAVKVNYITRVAELNDENAQKAGFENAVALADAADKHAIISSAWSSVLDSIKVIKYPSKEMKIQLKDTLEAYEIALAEQNLTMSDYAVKNEMSIDELKQTIEDNEVKNMIATNLVYYGIMQKSGYKLTTDDVNKAKEYIKTECEKNGLELSDYSDMYIEGYAAYTAAGEILLKNAKVK